MLLGALVLTILSVTESARILAVFPAVGYSQFILAEQLIKGLLNRGHELTVITTYSPKTKLNNYTEINVKSALAGVFEDELVEWHTKTVFAGIVEFAQIGSDFADAILSHTEVEELIHSDASFDLVLVENVMNDALLGLAARFNAPLVTFLSMGTCDWITDYVGNPLPPSYIPNVFTSYSSIMNLPQRVYNLAVSSFSLLVKYYYQNPKQNAILKRRISSELNLDDVIRNVSLAFVNSHPSVTEPLPLFPNIIEIAGFHIVPEKLPDDVQTFLDEAAEGAILFSMGSNVRSKDFSDEKKHEILAAFSKLRQRVLWKFEDDELPGRPNNLKISKWLPQRAVLVPIICIPIFADQNMNAAVSTKNGIALTLSFPDLSQTTLLNAIRTVLGDDSYRSNIQRRSEWLRDRPVSALDTFTYWIEFVIRHGGAPHLKSTAAVNMTLVQYLYLDATLILVVIYLSIYSVVKYFSKTRVILDKQKIEKKKKQ
ncbi:UDP-glucuronosyltransferase [Rhyzopertha dominica]|nr:UDP-glucuronosyltransferase [Rhyzopertha dominica]